LKNDRIPVEFSVEILDRFARIKIKTNNDLTMSNVVQSIAQMWKDYADFLPDFLSKEFLGKMEDFLESIGDEFEFAENLERLKVELTPSELHKKFLRQQIRTDEAYSKIFPITYEFELVNDKTDEQQQ
jgi:hypothetical protein